MFSIEDIDAFPNIAPYQMTPPFYKEEVRKAVRALNNNKTVDKDDLKVEQLT